MLNPIKHLPHALLPTLLAIVALSSPLSINAAHALDQPAPAAATPATSAIKKAEPVKADSAKIAVIRQALLKNYPGIKITTINATPLAGIYEVLTDGQLIYTDEKASYLFVGGSMVDAARKINLTEERMNRVTAIKFSELPLDMAFIRVRGKGERKVAIFSDPDCPYCKKLETDIAKLDNVTIYTFLFPIESLHPGATDHARHIWCSPDRNKAWDDLLQKNIAPTASPNCTNPVDKVIALGEHYKVIGTPTLVFADGLRVPGAMSMEKVEQHMADATAPR